MYQFLLKLLIVALSSALDANNIRDSDCEGFYSLNVNEHGGTYMPDICIANWYNLRNILVGTNVNLTCVTSPKVFGSILYDIHFSSTNGLLQDLTNSRLKIFPPRPMMIEQHEAVSQTVLIQNISKEDNGIYTCSLRSDMYHHMILESFDSEELFINFTIKEPNLFANEGDTVQWQGTVHSFHPIKLHLKTENPYSSTRGDNDFFDSKRDELKISEDGNFSLIIQSVMYTDFGNHSLVASNTNKTLLKSASISLTVNYAPVVVMTSDTVSVNKEYNFTCTVTAFPPANVTYYFKECNTLNESDCKAAKWVSWGTPRVAHHRTVGRLVNGWVGDFEGAADYVISKLAVASGKLLCEAENKMGRKLSSGSMCVTDGPVEPVIKAPNATFEGEDLIVSCLVSLCNSHDDIDISVGANSKRHPRAQFESSYGVFSKQLTMIIKNVEINDSGKYHCCYRLRGDFAHLDCNAVNILVLPEKGYSLFLWVIFALALGVIVAMLLILTRYIIALRRKKHLNLTILVQLRKGNIDAINPALPLHEQADLLPFDPKWEIPRDKLKMGKQLGAGFFGVVYYADAEGLRPGENKTSVAVKMAKRHSDPEVVRALVGELKIMAHLGNHLNVVRLIGTVIDNLAENELMLIVEFCQFGSLNTYLLKNRARFVDLLATNGVSEMKDEIEGTMPLNTNVLVNWAYQIAKGMDWLSGRKLLHGDLAARNVLLTEGNIVKISDFGLAKSLYSQQEYQKKNSGEKLPVKWMAIESIKDRVFSTKSDVWSYGILLWELFTLGSTPYPEFDTFQCLIRKLDEGYRMSKPVYSPNDIYEIMVVCWNADPQKRPNFSDICDKTYSRLEDATKDLYLELEVVESDYLLNIFQKPDLGYAYVNVPNSSGAMSDTRASKETEDENSEWLPMVQK